MVIKKIIPTFLFLSLFMQSILAGPKDRILPWLIGTIATSVGSVGYVVGRTAQEVAPQLTQQAVEQIANKAATQAAKQGPSLVAQAASSTWDVAKSVLPSLISKQGAGIAAGIAASAGAWYGWRNRAAIAKNGKRILENTRLIQDLRTYVEQQFTRLNAAMQRLHSRHDQTQADIQAMQQQLNQLQQQVQNNGNNIRVLTDVVQENNSLLHQITKQMHRGQNQILEAISLQGGRLLNNIKSFLSRN